MTTKSYMRWWMSGSPLWAPRYVVRFWKKNGQCVTRMNLTEREMRGLLRMLEHNGFDGS